MFHLSEEFQEHTNEREEQPIVLHLVTDTCRQIQVDLDEANDLNQNRTGEFARCLQLRSFGLRCLGEQST